MQKTITCPNMIESIEGVLIPGSDLKKREKVENILKQAKHHASKIIKEANIQAQTIRESAQSAGYQAGIILSINSVADFIDNNQSIYLKFYTKTHESMLKNLRHALNSPEIFPLLLEHWLADVIPDEEHSTLFLLVPKMALKQQSELSSYIASLWSGKVVIEQHTDNRFVIKYKNDLAEFSPDVWVEQQRIQADFCQQLEKDCNSLSSNSIQQLLNDLAVRLVK